MKQFFRSLLSAVLIAGAVSISAQAQTVPSGMNYQAVARDLSGNVLANEAIDLKITLTNRQGSGVVTYYTETHPVTTNLLGLFSVVIGEGKPTTGQFKSVPWSTDEVWMEIAIRSGSDTRFTTVSSSKLLAVPYAFHAGTAGQLVGSPNARSGAASLSAATDTGWLLTGNAGTSPSTNRLGTTDSQDLVIVTNGAERLRIASSGSAVLRTALRVGDALVVGGTTDLGGDVTLRRGLTVGKELKVTGRTELVDDVSLRKGLSVDGKATFNNAVFLNDNLTVKGISVSTTSSDYVATFQNTNPNDGDGLKIKLGKTHPGWDGSGYLNAEAPGTQALNLQLSTVKGWIYDGKEFQTSDLLNLFPAALYAGSATQLTNLITDQLNSRLGLPARLPDITIPSQTLLNETTIFPGLEIPLVDDIPALKIPKIEFPRTTIATSTVLVPAISKLPSDVFPAFTLPRLSATSVTNSLTKRNEFIAFTDKDDRNLGSIRAQSVNDFATDYLDGLYLTNLLSSLVGLDILKDALSVFSEFANLADAYSSLGVEYTSGHGDYAEWLERTNPAEVIGAGDVVGVRGGKITKDLRDAEQIMAISYRPIVLGNTPPAGKDHLGNKVAFMGQIPVKVLGAVSTGDYIVAKSEVPGYAVAVKPALMTIDDYKLAVGRSWEANVKAGPKMVNTLIGVHNGDFLKILKKNQQQVEQVEARLNTLEAKTNAILQTISPTIK